MTLNNYKKVACTTFLLIILAFSLVSVSSGLQSYSAISSTGMVSYWPQVFVNVNLSDVIGNNNLSLGFMLDHDWKIWRDRSVLRQLASDASFKMIRLFSHRIEPCTFWNESAKKGTFNWADVDLLIQRIFEIGAEPLICLGFYGPNGIKIPPGMAINSATGLPYPESFAEYCKEWVKHFKEVGFAVRYYEVINEIPYYFYKDWVYNETKLGYFLTLFNTCYNIVHSENNQILVGNDASLHRKFLDYWKAHGGKLDFLSFHKYDCDGLDMNDETPLLRAERRCFVTDGLWYGVNHARQIWGTNLPAIASECNWAATSGSGTDPRIQKLVGSVWLALYLRMAILEDVQYNIYYCFSSGKSWEQTKPSGGFGFGMINQDDNQPWYPYYVQKLIGTNLSIEDLIIESETSSSEIRSLAWFHNGTLNILLISKIDETRIIKLQGVEGQLSFSKIDNNVSYLTPSIQIGQVNAADGLITNGYTVILLQSSV